MSNNIRPNLAGAFIQNKPKLTHIDKILDGLKPERPVVKIDKQVEITKLGNFLCITVLLGFICYFIFFGKRSKNKETTKQQLEEIKKLNYTFFNN